eukprot:1194826-Prorocentrum_minimum.AAC.3
MIAVGKADECILEEILRRHEEISGLAENKQGCPVNIMRKDLGQIGKGALVKRPGFPRRIWVYMHLLGVHLAVRKNEREA